MTMGALSGLHLAAIVGGLSLPSVALLCFGRRIARGKERIERAWILGQTLLGRLRSQPDEEFRVKPGYVVGAPNLDMFVATLKSRVAVLVAIEEALAPVELRRAFHSLNERLQPAVAEYRLVWLPNARDRRVAINLYTKQVTVYGGIDAFLHAIREIDQEFTEAASFRIHRNAGTSRSEFALLRALKVIDALPCIII